jgi:hypothetical protein
MRKLFMVIFIPVLFVLGTPALVATLMYDETGESDMPIHLYVEGASAEDMLYEELTLSIDDLENGVTDDMIFNLNQDVINTAIFEAIRDPNVNPDYMPNDDCVEDSCNYIFAEPLEVEGFDISLRVVGVWVDFENDKFILNVYLEVELNDGMTYKTVLETHFILLDEADEYVLKFDKIQMGKLPVPSGFITSIMSTLDKQLDQIDLSNMLGDVPFGEFDAENLIYTLPKDDILEQLATDEGAEPDATAELSQEVLSIIFDKGLLTFEIVDKDFVLTAGVSKFKNDDEVNAPLYLNSMHFQEEIEGVTVYGEFDPNSFNPEDYLKDKFTEYIFNYALVSESDFIITEQTFNKLIYFGAEGFSDTRTTYEYIDKSTGETQVMDIGLKAIWFDLTPGEIYINALFKIAGIDSLLQISAVDVSDVLDGSQLMFEFTEITFGKDELETDMDYLSIVDLDVFKQVFADLGDVEFGEFDENGTLVISIDKLSEIMNDASANQAEGTVSVVGIEVVQDGIKLDIEVNAVYADVIEDFATALNEVVGSTEIIDNLEVILETETEGPEQEVYDAVVELQNLLGDGDPETNPSADLLIDMFVNFEDLDPETQEAFIGAFEELIPEGLLDEYENLFTN